MNVVIPTGLEVEHIPTVMDLLASGRYTCVAARLHELMAEEGSPIGDWKCGHLSCDGCVCSVIGARSVQAGAPLIKWYEWAGEGRTDEE